ncbi:MAG: MFS transporter [Acidobacteria bacterium]|nr:MFS transporter [Acidobacteriota bacterium]
MRRIMPYVFILYIIAFLDRVNIGYAALEMTKDLGFTAEVYGFGAGIFFIGYVLLEIPGTLLVENWSARGWIARIMISWGILATLMGFIHTATQFYWVRFLLGAAEAGFFPGIIVYLSHWFGYEDRAKAVALFMAAIPISNIIGSPLSGLLLGINWFGLAGWRWLFILEGAPAIIFGIATIFYLTDWPHQAKWLLAGEREWITAELDQEKQRKNAEHSYRIWEALKHREVIMLTLAYFFIVTSLYGFNFWLPTIIKKLSGLPNLLVTLIAALPYCIGLIAMLLIGWSSDRTGERRWHTALPMIVTSLGLLLSAVTQNNAAVAIAMFCLAAAGLSGYLPGFWALPTSFLTGSAAAAAIGLINSVGNIGGFVGPYVVGYVRTATNSFFGGVLYLSLSALVAAGFILALRQAKQ